MAFEQIFGAIIRDAMMPYISRSHIMVILCVENTLPLHLPASATVADFTVLYRNEQLFQMWWLVANGNLLH